MNFEFWEVYLANLFSPSGRDSAFSPFFLRMNHPSLRGKNLSKEDSPYKKG